MGNANFFAARAEQPIHARYPDATQPKRDKSELLGLLF
jgi:hypothetical protein